MKPFAAAAEENRHVIMEILAPRFATTRAVLEVGSGTGQHAVFFASQFPHLQWIATEREDQLAGLRLWVEESALSNLQGPYALDVSQSTWPIESVDGVFSANTLHIMSWPEVEMFFLGTGRVLAENGLICIYGPFNYDGEYTSESNRRFDSWLKQLNPKSGIRDVTELKPLAEKNGLVLVEDVAMPVNNRILVFKKSIELSVVS